MPTRSVIVHELTWEEIKTMLDNAITVKPRRQMSVQFSGGEPTLSPYFLDAVRYARKVGFNSVQAATNGIEFAKSFEFAQQAVEAGMRYAYLQFDGIGNAANDHRAVGNLFDVKLKAIDNLHKAGCEIVPVITIINGINNEQVGRIIQFALDNPKKISFLSFQPVVYRARRSDHRRPPQAQRYTLAHLAHDVKNQTGIGEPARDWFPISFMSTFSDWADLCTAEDANNDWGQLSCGCHPNCGTGMAMMIDKETKEAVPVTAFLNGDQLGKDIAKVNDAARRSSGPFGMALLLMKNYDPFQAPTHFKMMDLLRKFDKNFNATGKNYGKVGPDRTIDDVMKRRQDRWNFLFIAGMWFQDLFNYDFRRTEQCIIPYATQEGEISFCAYNTGVGWRNIIEKMHMTATLTKWYEEHGRHEIFAGGKKVKMPRRTNTLPLPARRDRHERSAARPRQAGNREDGARREDSGARREAGRASPWTAEERSGLRRPHGAALSRSGAEREAGDFGRRRIHSAGRAGCSRVYSADRSGERRRQEDGGCWRAGGGRLEQLLATSF
jgi:7,8-dihydro-6-hydroxymethylpterin dimethyltransferase